jgi:hypothetical protein
MDARERIESLETFMIAALEGWQTSIWTALPCIVTQVDLNTERQAMTVSAQPTIKVPLYNKQSVASLVQLPVLQKLPICFPGGGGFTLTFPVRVGDECLVVFSSRAIDAWWQQGGIQNQPDVRLHDLSDGFAIVGVKSQPNVLPSISATAVQLRSDDGSTYLELGAGAVKVSTGASGTFTTTGGQTVTVQNGIVTNIYP